MKISEFTTTELQKLRIVCNFTPSELELFNLRAGDVSLLTCAERMNRDYSSVCKISRKVNEKIQRIISGRK